MGMRVCMPHQIGIKLMSKIKFKKKLNIPKNIRAHVEQQRQARQAERDALQGRVEVEVIPWNDYKVSDYLYIFVNENHIEIGGCSNV